MNRLIPTAASEEVLKRITDGKLPFAYDFAKHKIIVTDNLGNGILDFRLPFTTSQKVDTFEKEHINYVILLVQSGNCALGYYEGGINIDHKVFRSYMIRKKQGKSQVKYLKTRGKSKAGSRVRLGETIEFFENINGRLNEYFEEYTVDRIAISCSKILIPYLFNSKIKTPFDRKDPRIYKIPRHIHTPIYEVMADTNRYLLKGELIYEDPHQSLVDDLLENIFEDKLADEQDDY
jgi:hypothetical protein